MAPAVCSSVKAQAALEPSQGILEVLEDQRKYDTCVPTRKQASPKQTLRLTEDLQNLGKDSDR